jgi:acetyl-CoA carboxylase carboxyltransferase component
MWHLPVPEQVFVYAEAYRKSSATLCQKMTDDPATFAWPHGSVVLMLGAHAVILFLKSALLKRNLALLEPWAQH